MQTQRTTTQETITVSPLDQLLDKPLQVHDKDGEVVRSNLEVLEPFGRTEIEWRETETSWRLYSRHPAGQGDWVPRVIIQKQVKKKRVVQRMWCNHFRGWADTACFMGAVDHSTHEMREFEIEEE